MKDRKHEDWIEALRDAAAGGNERPPEELWQRISAQLDAPAVKPAGSRRRLYVWTASVAAAAVVAALGVFLLRTPAAGPEAAAIADSTAVPADIVAPADSIQTGLPVVLPEDTVDNTPVRQRTARIEKAVEVDLAEAVEVVCGDPQPVTDTAGETAVPVKDEPSPEPRKVEKPGNEAVYAANTVTVSGRRANKRSSGLKGMLAFSAGGIASAASGNPAAAEAGSMMAMVGNSLAPDTDGLMVMISPPEKYSYRHRQPLTFAIAFDLNVGPNLFVGAGVSYTKLSSTVSVIGSDKEFSQRLQYIGIPVSFKWSFLNTRFLTLYTGAEVQPEFCVDARFGKEDVNIPSMQWSVHVLAGAQFNMGRHVGIYAEPKLSHYFRETSLETVRNTKGVNFNLQLGLRFTY